MESEISLEKALETIKQINDRYEQQLQLTEAAKRSDTAAKVYYEARAGNRRVWR